MLTIIFIALAVISYILMRKIDKLVWFWFTIFAISSIAASGTFVYYVCNSNLPTWLKWYLIS